MIKYVNGEAWQNSAFSNLAYVEDEDGDPITQAAIDSITLSVTKESDGEVVIDEDDLDPADCIFDTLQDSDAWTANEDGYNFRHDAEGLVDAGEWHLFEYTFTPAVGNPFIGAAFRIRVKALANP